MADTPSVLLRQLLIDISQLNDLSSVEALDCKKDISSVFDALMISLRKMMLGYENERVHGIFEEMERLVDHVVAVPHIGILVSNEILEACEELYNIRFSSIIEAKGNVVGFDDEVETLLHQLTETSTKQLQVISIVGMAGLGKTTLARRLYKDPLIEYTFDIRAWTCVSQVYRNRDLLLGILSSSLDDLSNEFYDMSEEQLGEKLYRLLKGHQYLVVLDDIWDCKAWNDLRMYFPDDKTGSRVLFTSRDIDLTLHVQGARPAHVLRLRTADESWDIFRKTVFRTGMCPYPLRRIGMEIAEKCEGLPLSIVITAGLLKNHSSHAWWRKVAESLHSLMVREPSQYMDSLSLSYNHLPPHLRQCFVFVGVFPEDYDIPVKKLIWLWIAQGFIHETGCKNLEEVAQDFLMDLIKRSLLMTAKMRADGQIKACRIHDLFAGILLEKSKGGERFAANLQGCTCPDSCRDIFKYHREHAAWNAIMSSCITNPLWFLLST